MASSVDMLALKANRSRLAWMLCYVMVDVLKNQFFKAFIRIDTTDFVRVFSWVVAFLNVCRWAEEAGKYGLIDPYQCSRN